MNTNEGDSKEIYIENEKNNQNPNVVDSNNISTYEEMGTSNYDNEIIAIPSEEKDSQQKTTVKMKLPLNIPDLQNYPPLNSFSHETETNHSDMDLIDMEEESFYSQSENEHGDDNIWGLLSGVAGNIYEWYDFAVYGLLSSEIGACFFPQSDKKMQLIGSFGVFLAAFVMR